MLLEKQNLHEEVSKKDISLESSLTELPARSLTELEQEYYESIQSIYPN